jgi:hypothetical protein
MKLIRADKLTREQRQRLAVAARKKRPGAKYREEFRTLTRRRRKLRQIARANAALLGWARRDG